MVCGGIHLSNQTRVAAINMNVFETETMTHYLYKSQNKPNGSQTTINKQTTVNGHQKKNARKEMTVSINNGINNGRCSCCRWRDECRSFLSGAAAVCWLCWARKCSSNHRPHPRAPPLLRPGGGRSEGGRTNPCEPGPLPGGNSPRPPRRGSTPRRAVAWPIRRPA